MSPHLKGACWRFPLGWYFTSPTLHDIQHGMRESPRIRRGENTDQFSIRSSSVLTALIASKVGVSYALLPAPCRRCCMHAARLAYCAIAAIDLQSNTWCHSYLDTLSFINKFYFSKVTPEVRTRVASSTVECASHYTTATLHSRV